MFVITLAVGGGTALAVGVAGAVGTGLLYEGARKSQSHATSAIEKSNQEANDIQLDMYETSRQDQLPWMQAGERALGEVERLTAEGPGDFESSEYFQQGLGESQRALDTYLSSRGLAHSGAAPKEYMREASELNKRNRGNWLNEWISTKLNPNQATAGMGQTTATNVGREGTTVGANLAAGIRDTGVARGTGYINKANLLTDTVQGGLNSLAQYYGSRSPTKVINSPGSYNTGNYGPVQ